MLAELAVVRAIAPVAANAEASVEATDFIVAVGDGMSGREGGGERGGKLTSCWRVQISLSWAHVAVAQIDGMRRKGRKK